MGENVLQFFFFLFYSTSLTFGGNLLTPAHISCSTLNITAIIENFNLALDSTVSKTRTHFFQYDSRFHVFIPQLSLLRLNFLARILGAQIHLKAYRGFPAVFSFKH